GGVLGQGLQQPHSTAAAAAAVAANHLLHTTTTATTPTPAPPPPLLAAGTTASPGGAHILSTPGLPGVSSSPAAGASGIPPSAGTIGGGKDDEEGDKNRKHDEERRGGKGGGLGRNSEEDHSHTFPPAPTKIDSRVVLLTNMVTPAEVDDELKDEVRQECSKFGEINRVEVHPLSDDVRIFVEFSSLTGAQEAIPSLHGRWFGGRQIIANTYSESSFAQGDFTH
ncbi:rna recognition motif-containing protein, partial [Cystoisospora suis]